MVRLLGERGIKYIWGRSQGMKMDSGILVQVLIRRKKISVNIRRKY
jgi:hypothetical protein